MIELTVRVFYTCDDGVHLVPSQTFTAPKDIQPVDVAKIAEKLAKELDEFPATGVRPMTDAEVVEYRAREEADEGAGYEVVDVD